MQRVATILAMVGRGISPFTRDTKAPGGLNVVQQCGGSLGPHDCRWICDNVTKKSQSVSLLLSLKKDILRVSRDPL